MDKLSYAILDLLNDKDCSSNLKSLTRNEIEENIDSKKITIYRRLKILIDKGYVISGVKDSKSFTYYISQKGIQILQEGLR